MCQAIEQCHRIDRHIGLHGRIFGLPEDTLHMHVLVVALWVVVGKVCPEYLGSESHLQCLARSHAWFGLQSGIELWLFIYAEVVYINAIDESW